MRINRHVLASILLPALLASTGCLDAEQSLVINPDGSGTLDVKYSIAEATVRRVQSMLELSESLPTADEDAPAPAVADKFLDLIFKPTEAELRKQLDAYSALGFTVEEFEFRNENAKRRVSFLLSFDDVSVFTKADFFHTYGFSLRKNAKGQHILYTRPVTREAPHPSAWDFSDPETRKTIAPFLNGFRVSVNITVPGRILKTNAHNTTGNLLHWTYAFDSDPFAIQKMQRDQLSVVFDAKNATLPLFQQPARPE